MKMLQVFMILLMLYAMRSSGDCIVSYAGPTCAVRGFSVSIPCSFKYSKSNPNSQVTQKLWCSMNSNNGWCTDPPYVYDSKSNTESDFEYAGDDQSNCTLLIHNVEFSYSGEYKFRLITNDNNIKCTGDPGVVLQVSDLKVSLIRLSGNGTLKQGDSLNLTCDVNCTHSSSQFVWSKNNERLPESGPVLHFPALTVRDSGKYTCTWKTNRASGSETISFDVEGVLTQNSDWGVNYPDYPICAVRGFSVSIPCYYYYPQRINLVTQMLWCSMNSNTDGCKNPPYVYDSKSNTKPNFEYVGNNKSDCTLLIHNVEFSYSGKYKFRFITNEDRGKWTGQPGVTLQVEDLKVSLIRLGNGNGTLKQGDSLNLTCDVNCTHSSSQFVWSKNNERLPESGPFLHFPALTVRDSGNYTCTWKTNMTAGSETISFDVEAGKNPSYWPIWIIAVATAGVMFIILLMLGTVIYSRRKDDTPEAKDMKVGEQTQPKPMFFCYTTTDIYENENENSPVAKVKQDPHPNEDMSQQEEVTYASVCVKGSNLNNGFVDTKQKNDDTVIYSTVAIK